MTLARLTAMLVAAPFGGVGVFLLWETLCGAGLWRWAAAMLLLAAAIPLAADE